MSQSIPIPLTVIPPPSVVSRGGWDWGSLSEKSSGGSGRVFEVHRVCADLTSCLCLSVCGSCVWWSACVSPGAASPSLRPGSMDRRGTYRVRVDVWSR